MIKRYYRVSANHSGIMYIQWNNEDETGYERKRRSRWYYNFDVDGRDTLRVG